MLSTNNCAVAAPMPGISTGVAARRSKFARQVAEPAATSPVRVSIKMMDHVAAAGPAAIKMPEAAARKWRECGMAVFR